MNFAKKSLFLVLVLALSGTWLGSQTARTLAEPEALSVTVLSPNGAAADTVGEGDDYFTQVLHEPRDMNDHTDLIWQSFGIDNISFSNGVWSGTTHNTPAPSYSEIYPLYPGFSIPNHPDSAAEIGKIGKNYPIQTSKYKQFSFRIKAPDGAGAIGNPWWHVTFENQPYPMEFTHYEGQYRNATGWQVYVANLASKSEWTSNASMYGLGFRFGLTTGNYQFDWIRLTDPTTSPVYQIKFSVGGTVSGDVVDLECYTSSQASADTSCGTLATNIAVNTPGTYQYDWHTAYLPPDDYYVRAIVRHGSATASDMSNGALHIAAAPLMAFTAPSMTSGPDYAATEVGAPWDMSDSNSIFTSSDLYRFPHDFQAPCPCFANGELYGTVGRFDGQDSPEFGDPFVYLRVSRNKPIDTAKYKYLTYRYKIDRSPWWQNSGDRLSYDDARKVWPAAWLVRGIFFSDWPLSVASASNTLNDIIVFDDWNVYQMDLSQGSARGYWEPEAPQTGSYWSGFKSALRFDFLEGVDPWTVHLDYVKLTGDDEATNSYIARWSQLAGSAPKTIDVYASTNRNACLQSGSKVYHWQAGSSATPPPAGSHKVFLPLLSGGGGGGGPDDFTWNTSSVAADTYYLCARINDGYNTSTTISDAAVIISH